MTAADILSTVVPEPPTRPDQDGADVTDGPARTAPDEEMLNGRQEAARRGVHPSVITRARKLPGHPANDDRYARTVTIGKLNFRVVHQAAIDRYWRGKSRKQPGPRPDGVYLAAAAKGEPIPKRSREKLIGRGLLGDDGKPTDAGLAVLAGSADVQEAT